MGAVIPAALAFGPGGSFTPLDCDEESLAVVTKPSSDAVVIDDSAIRADLECIEICRTAHRDAKRRRMASAALVLMDRGRVDLLDADFDPWSVGTPANKGFVDHRPIEPSALQMVFANTIVSIRSILETRTDRPLTVFEAIQTTSVPCDAIALNLMYYLNAEGHITSPLVVRQSDGSYILKVVVE